LAAAKYRESITASFPEDYNFERLAAGAKLPEEELKNE